MEKPITVNGNKSVTVERWLIIAVLGFTLAGAVWAGFSKLGKTIMQPQVIKLEKRVVKVEIHQEVIKKDVREIKEDVKWMRNHFKFLLDK